jgi:formylglycine-generating enzyme required for sulfatase activity
MTGAPLRAQGEPAPVLFAPSAPGAVVLLDGRVLCRQTPCSPSLEPGTYHIQILKERHEPWEARQALRPGDRVAPTLEPSVGTLRVRSAQAGAQVRVDGEPVGQTPLKPLELEAGLHTVEVSAPCARAVSRALYLGAGQSREVDLSPVARQAWLEVAVVQPNGGALRAQVTLDGEPLGQAPGLFQVSACARALEVRHLELGSRQRLVGLRQGQRTRVEVTLGGLAVEAVASSAPAGMVRVSPGAFVMGVPGPTQHRVTLTRPFWIQRNEVTQRDWAQVMGSNPACYKDCGEGCPVERVSWWDALVYLNRMSERDGLPACYQLEGCRGTPGGGCPGDSDHQCEGDFTCKDVTFAGVGCRGWRLPTEAEWEYAARAGGDHPRAQDANAMGWFDKNSGGGTHKVAGKPPNAWGLYDMFGNVSEWTWDRYLERTSADATDPTGPTRHQASDRAARGGYYGNDPGYLSRGYRHGVNAEFRGAGLGFRAARTAY